MADEVAENGHHNTENGDVPEIELIIRVNVFVVHCNCVFFHSPRNMWCVGRAYLATYIFHTYTEKKVSSLCSNNEFCK